MRPFFVTLCGVLFIALVAPSTAQDCSSVEAHLTNCHTEQPHILALKPALSHVDVRLYLNVSGSGFAVLLPSAYVHDINVNASIAQSYLTAAPNAPNGTAIGSCVFTMSMAAPSTDGTFTACPTVPGRQYALWVYVTGNPAETELTGAFAQLTFIAGDFCPLGRGGNECQWPLIELPIDAALHNFGNYTLAAGEKMYFTFRQPVAAPYLAINRAPPSFTYRVNRATSDAAYTFVSASAYCAPNTCGNPNILWAGEISPLVKPDLLFYERYGPQQTPTTFTSLCSTSMCTRRTWVFVVGATVSAPQPIDFSIDFFAGDVCAGRGNYTAGPLWQPGPCTCNDLLSDNADYAYTASWCSDLAVTRQCCAPCPEGKRGPMCQYDTRSPARVVIPTTTPSTPIVSGYFTDTVEPKTTGTLFNYTLPMASNSPFMLFIDVQLEATGKTAAEIEAVKSTLRLTGQRVYGATCSYNGRWFDGDPTHQQFDLSPWANGDGMITLLPRGDTNAVSTYPAHPCLASLEGPLMQASTLSLLLPARNVTTTITVHYVEMCGGRGGYQLFAMTCNCAYPWSGQACKAPIASMQQRDYEVRGPCCTATSVTAAIIVYEATYTRNIGTSPSEGTVHEGSMTIPRWQQDGYIRVRVPNLQRSTGTLRGYSVEITITADESTCPASLRGQYMLAVNCDDGNYDSWCIVGDSFVGFVSNVNNRSFTHSVTLPGNQMRIARCGCSASYGSGVVFTVKAKLNRFDGCQATVNATVTPHCMNGGTINTVYGSCVCPEGFMGTRCELTAPVLSKLHLSLDQVGLTQPASFRGHPLSVTPMTPVLLRVNLPLGLPANAYTWTITAEAETPESNCSNIRLVERYSCATWTGAASSTTTSTATCGGQMLDLSDVGAGADYWPGSCAPVAGQPGNFTCTPQQAVYMAGGVTEENCGCEKTPIDENALWAERILVVYLYDRNTSLQLSSTAECRVHVRMDAQSQVALAVPRVHNGSCPTWMPIDCEQAEITLVSSGTARVGGRGQCQTSFNSADNGQWHLDPQTMKSNRNNDVGYMYRSLRTVLAGRCICATGNTGIDCRNTLVKQILDSDELVNKETQIRDVSFGEVVRARMRVSKSNNQVTLRLSTGQSSSWAALTGLSTIPRWISAVYVRARVGEDPPMPVIANQNYRTIWGRTGSATVGEWKWVADEPTTACRDHFFMRHEPPNNSSGIQEWKIEMKNGGIKVVSDGRPWNSTSLTQCISDSGTGTAASSLPFSRNDDLHILIWTEGYNKLPIKPGCTSASLRKNYDPTSNPTEASKGCLPLNNGLYGPGYGTDPYTYTVSVAGSISDTVADIIDYIAVSMVGLAGLFILISVIKLAREPGGLKSAIERGLTKKVTGDKLERKAASPKAGLEFAVLSPYSTSNGVQAAMPANASTTILVRQPYMGSSQVAPHPSSSSSAIGLGSPNNGTGGMWASATGSGKGDPSTAVDPIKMAKNAKNEEKQEKAERENIICYVISRVLVGIVALVVAILLAGFTTMFNISLLHSSLQNVTSNILSIDIMPTVEKLQAAMRDALSVLRAPWWLRDGLAEIRSWFSWMDVITGLGLGWNCGGALSMFTPLVLLLGALLLMYLLQKDVLLVMGIKGRGELTGRSFLYRQFRLRLAQGATMASLLVLQSLIVILPQTVGSIWGIRRSCSDIDYEVVTVGRSLSIVCIVAFFYIAPLMFAGVSGLSFKDLTWGWVRGLVDLFLLAVGIWSPHRVQRFDVIRRAETFDNDLEDTDNLQQDVMELLAKSRSLMWMPIPGGVVLTQLAACVNMPPLLIWNYPRTGLILKSGVYKRTVLWLISMSRFILYITAVFVPAEYAFLGAMGAQVLFIFVDTLWPASKLLTNPNGRR